MAADGSGRRTQPDVADFEIEEGATSQGLRSLYKVVKAREQLLPWSSPANTLVSHVRQPFGPTAVRTGPCSVHTSCRPFRELPVHCLVRQTLKGRGMLSLPFDKRGHGVCTACVRGSQSRDWGSLGFNSFGSSAHPRSLCTRGAFAQSDVKCCTNTASS